MRDRLHDLSAIDAALAARQRSGGPMIVYLCSCGFATDDADWLHGHLDEHPGHFQQRVVRDIPYQRAGPVMLPVRL